MVFISERPAARIVVVLAMPTTRMPGRSTSASVRIPEAAVNVGAFDEAIGRSEFQSLLALLIDQHKATSIAGDASASVSTPVLGATINSIGTPRRCASSLPRSAVTPRGLPPGSLTMNRADIFGANATELYCCNVSPICSAIPLPAARCKRKSLLQSIPPAWQD